MNIKSNIESYLLEPSSLLKFTGIKSEKFVVINKNDFSYQITDNSEYITTSTWEEENIDGRKLKKVKKLIIEEFGDNLLSDYKKTEKIYNTLSSSFINTSGISEVLRNGLTNDMNIILFGKGGYGKSEMCSALFNVPELRDRVFIKSLSEATTEEDLFGGINIKKMTEEGVVEYICENSFANKEIVIFEEIFDANPRVLAALKDTLTSKEIRNGNQRFPIKTKIIIGLTNKTYEEVIQDDSTEALTQRFPISYKVEYPLTKLHIAGLVLNRYKDFDGGKLVAMMETLHGNKDITPRKVLEMGKYLKDLKIIKSRNYDEKITNNNIAPVIDFIKMKKGINMSKSLFEEVAITRKDIREEVVKDYDSLVDLNKTISILSGAVKEEKFNSLADELAKLISKAVA